MYDPEDLEMQHGVGDPDAGCPGAQDPAEVSHRQPLGPSQPLDLQRTSQPYRAGSLGRPYQAARWYS
jgi:hypothetical protein